MGKKHTVEQIRSYARLLEWLESDREAYDDARDRRLPPFGLPCYRRREPLRKTMCAIPVERVCRNKNGGITATDGRENRQGDVP